MPHSFKLTLDWTGFSLITSSLELYQLDPTVMEPNIDASSVLTCDATSK